MADINLLEEIERVMDFLEERKTIAGRSGKARLLAIAITHLETARLFIKESEQKFRQL